MPNALETALEKLFAAEPGEFMATRTALAKELIAKSKREDAKTVAGQHKPTAAAFVLNRISREFPEEIGELARIGKKLGGAKTADQLREAMAAQRNAVRALTGKATPLLKTLAGGRALLPKLSTLLQAATTSPERAEELRLGRFMKEPEASATFLEQFSGGAGFGVPAKKADPEPKKAAPKKQSPATAKKDPTEKNRKLAEKAAERELQARQKQEAAEAKRVALELAFLQKEFDRADGRAASLERAAERAVKLATEAREHAEESRAKLEAAKR